MCKDHTNHTNRNKQHERLDINGKAIERVIPSKPTVLYVCRG